MDAVLWIVGVVVGSTLPLDHVAARTVSFCHPPEDVWAAVNAPRDQCGARPGDGHERAGGILPPRLLVRKVIDERDYRGTWTREIAPTAEACMPTITESAYILNLVLLFMSKYVAVTIGRLTAA